MPEQERARRRSAPHQHTEAITSRPLMFYGIAKQTRHAGQTHLTISSPHAEAEKVEQSYRNIAAFFNELLLLRKLIAIRPIG